MDVGTTSEVIDAIDAIREKVQVLFSEVDLDSREQFARESGQILSELENGGGSDCGPDEWYNKGFGFAQELAQYVHDVRFIDLVTLSSENPGRIVAAILLELSGRNYSENGYDQEKSSEFTKGFLHAVHQLTY